MGRERTKQNKSKDRERKLTAVERRRIEREEKRRQYGDDPLSAFDDGMSRPNQPSMKENISNFGGVDVFGDTQDYFSLNYGDYAEPSPPRNERKSRLKEEKETSSVRIKPASKISREQRRRRTNLLYISVGVLIVFAAMCLSLTVVFRTTDIRIEGGDDIPYSDEEIIETSGLRMNENIFMSKKKAAIKQLIDTYPYIEGASISVKIPGTQIIELDVAVPSYQVQFSGGYAVVSENSRILEVNPSQKNSIPLLKGLKLRETQPGEYITFEKEATKQILDEVVKNINSNNIENIYGINISNAANIELNYDNRITILLGLPEDVGYKLRTARAIIQQSLSPTEKGTLDVSLANSDRRSSYFTPIYSDAASLPDGGSSSQPVEAESDVGREYLDDIID